jgi:hypothetical protein
VCSPDACLLQSRIPTDFAYFGEPECGNRRMHLRKVCPIPDACLLVMAQRPYRLLGLPETRSLIFLIKNSPDQAEGYLDYLQPSLSLSLVSSLDLLLLSKNK